MPSIDLAIVDSGGANLASLGYALSRIGQEYTLTRDADVIRNASHVILPGVGAAPPAMERLQTLALHDVVETLTQPVLGICLGLQLLAEHSDEGPTDCLGIAPGTATRLIAAPDLPVPNMGWCPVDQARPCALFDGIDNHTWFYFVHSYYLPVGTATVGIAEHSVPFTAVLNVDNFYATQFHPEKSAAAGRRVLQNFVGLAA
ncbi:MAG: imidazole glycerol phosphate synthase subunit HisH [Pseudomonadota bacterium]